METKKAETLYGSEFLRLAENPDSYTYKLSQNSGIPVKSIINWRWQMKHQVVNSQEAEKFLKLSSDEVKGFKELNQLFNAGITPYYMGLMNSEITGEKGSQAIRLQGIPKVQEKVDKLGEADPLEEVGHSPVKEVVHVYPDRVAFCVAQICPVYCRYCFRKRRDEESGLHFNRKIVSRGIEYIRSNPAIRDVLITGGDPFLASDDALDQLLSDIKSIPHVEIIRFGTRTPVTLPYRVTKKLANILAKHHPVWVNTHFNHPAEITPEAQLAVENLVNAGIPVGNQSVFLKGVNDDEIVMKELSTQLLKSRVRPYYVFHPHNVDGTEHLRFSVDRGLEIMKSLRGKITGFGIPTYALDTPSGKIPLQHNHILGRDGDDLILEGLHGEVWREKGVLKN